MEHHAAEVIELDMICRLCGNMNINLSSLLDDDGRDLADKIHTYLNFNVSLADALPHKICIHCTMSLLDWHNFYQSCSRTNIKLKEMILNSLELEQDKQLTVILDDQTESVDEEALFQDPVDDDVQYLADDNVGADEDEEQFVEKTVPDIICGADTAFQVDDIFPNDPEEVVDTTEPENRRASKRKLPRNFQRTKRRRGKIPLKQCPYCENLVSYFLTDTKLNEHLKAEHKDRLFECEMCSQILDRSLLLSHMTEHAVDVDNRLTAADGQKVVKCLAIRTDEGQVKYKCSFCEKLYNYRENCYVHWQQAHSSDARKTYPCRQCEKVFHYSCALKNHLKNMHSTERNYGCDSCVKSFKTSSSLFSHKKLVHGTKFDFPCKMCDKKFKLAQQLNRHLRTDHLKENEHFCEVCGRGFYIKNYLTKHMAVHQKEGIKCDFCDFKTKQKRNLASHIKRMHKD